MNLGQAFSSGLIPHPRRHWMAPEAAAPADEPAEVAPKLTRTEQVLAYLINQGTPARQVEIARALDVSQANASMILAKMIGRGLVERVGPGLYDVKQEEK